MAENTAPWEDFGGTDTQQDSAGPWADFANPSSGKEDISSLQDVGKTIAGKVIPEAPLNMIPQLSAVTYTPQIAMQAGQYLARNAINAANRSDDGQLPEGYEETRARQQGQQLMGAIYNSAREKFGKPPLTQEEIAQLPSSPADLIPTPNNITNWVANAIGKPLYEPQTAAGRMTGTVGTIMEAGAGAGLSDAAKAAEATLTSIATGGAKGAARAALPGVGAAAAPEAIKAAGGGEQAQFWGSLAGAGLGEIGNYGAKRSLEPPKPELAPNVNGAGKASEQEPSQQTTKPEPNTTKDSANNIARAEMAKKAIEEYNIPLSVSQLTPADQAKFTKGLVSSAKEVPFNQGGDFAQKQKEAFNIAIAKTFGQDLSNTDGRITPEVIKKAYEDIGKRFDDTFKGRDITIPQETIDNINGILNEAKESSTSPHLVQNSVNMLLNSIRKDGTASGDKLNNLRSLFKKRSSLNNDAAPFNGQLADQIINLVDDPLAREQYKNLKVVDPLASVTAGGEGFVSPASLNNRLVFSRYFPDYTSGGGGSLGDLARIGSTFLRDTLPNSGTAFRNKLNQFYYEAPLGVGAALATGSVPAGVLGMTMAVPAARAVTALDISQPRVMKKIERTLAKRKTAPKEEPIVPPSSQEPPVSQPLALPAPQENTFSVNPQGEAIQTAGGSDWANRTQQTGLTPDILEVQRNNMRREAQERGLVQEGLNDNQVEDSLSVWNDRDNALRSLQDALANEPANLSKTYSIEEKPYENETSKATGNEENIDVKPQRTRGDIKTPDMIQWIVKRGGIREDDRNIGDVKAIIGKENHFFPGQGWLINKNGRGNYLDYIGGGLGDANYPIGEYGERPTINDVLDSLAEHVPFGNKRIFSNNDKRILDIREEKEGNKAYRRDLENSADEYGLDYDSKTTNDELERAIREHQSQKQAYKEFINALDDEEEVMRRQYIPEEKQNENETIPFVGDEENINQVLPSHERSEIKAENPGSGQETMGGNEKSSRPSPGTRASRVKSVVSGQDVNVKPTEPQKQAGNYKKGHTTFNGLPITIENPVGSIRRGVSHEGVEWKSKLPADYGYIKRTEGADGDHVDVYIGPDRGSKKVFVIDQIDPKTGLFDEHKAMLGFKDQESAIDAYNKSFSDNSGPDRIGAITPMPMDLFKTWAKEGNTKKPLDYEGDVLDKKENKSKMQRNESPVFYSALTRSIENIKQDKAPRQQWEGIINNLAQNGVKNEEIEWSGLKDWIKQQEGPVSKKDVLDYLKANDLQVKEVMKGEGDYAVDDGDVRKFFNDRISAENYAKSIGINITEDTVYRATNRNGGYGTKYSQWQLPGGENYHELLLTLPEKTNDNAAIFAKSMRDKYGDRWISSLTPDENKEYDSLIEKTNEGTSFKSSHFEEPNIVAHIRFNDRTGPNGEKILNIEEIQSDWHQAGRKKGYAENPKPQVSTEKLIELTNAAKDAMRSVDNLGFDTPNEAMRNALAHPDWETRWPISDKPEVAEIVNRWIDAQPTNPERNLVPNAPFKTTWPELAFKRALRYAVENGYDKITWTTGEQQAARYDLSKQVERVIAAKEDGKFRVFARDLNGKNHDMGALSADELPEAVGKDLAKKIASQKQDSVTYEGVDLKVGGEGMKGFYDDMLPKMVNKLVKKWGGKTERTQLKLTDMPFSEYEKYPADHPYVKTNAPFVHSLEITDAMRESVMQGLPLFQKSGEISKTSTTGMKRLSQNLFALNREFSPKETDLINIVRDELSKIAPSVKFEPYGNLVEEAKGKNGKTIRSEVTGGYQPELDMIALSLAPRKGKAAIDLSDALNTVRHEAMHHLEEQGFLNNREIETLRKAASQKNKDGKTWYDIHKIDERYSDASPEMKFWEAVNEQYAKWERGEQSIPQGAIKKIFYKIKTLFENIARRIRLAYGRNITADDIFENISQGYTGRRKPAKGKGTP